VVGIFVVVLWFLLLLLLPTTDDGTVREPSIVANRAEEEDESCIDGCVRGCVIYFFCGLNTDNRKKTK